MTGLKRWLRKVQSVDPIDKALEVALEVEGQVSPKELLVLMDLASQVRRGHVIVEIGTYRGRSAVALALGSRLGCGGRVYAVDPHLEFRGAKGGQFGPQDMAALYANLDRAGVGELVAVACLPSTAVAKTWPEQNVGLLWLDGDHSYEGVRSDFDAWFPHVVSGGTVVFHDVDAPGVGPRTQAWAGFVTGARV